MATPGGQGGWDAKATTTDHRDAQAAPWQWGFITYHAPSAVDADVANPDAVQPLGLPELPETILLHPAGIAELGRLWGTGSLGGGDGHRPRLRGIRMRMGSCARYLTLRR